MTTVIEKVSVETVLMVQMMKKNTILRFMGELSGKYLKLVFPKIEPHKCVKKTKRGAEESTDKKDRIRNMLYESNRRSRRRRKRRQMRDIYNPTYILYSQ